MDRVTRREALATAGLAGVALATPGLLLAEIRANGTPTRPIDTNSGKVRGLRGGGVSAFLGIPYGADTSAYRFQITRPAKPWAGVRDCFKIGHQAPQMEINAAAAAGPGANLNSDWIKTVMTIFRTGMEVGNEGEDCLVLNIWTPDASPARKRPVMFWIHGGGFTIGSGGDPQYDGARLARRGDVVVVTVNHRLNALGYLYLGDIHSDFADSGNIGQLDLVAAMQWVRANIAQFGGDPNNVMIFGESGGGSKVSTLLAMPPAKSLFHKAAIESGPGLTMVPKADAVALAEAALAELGIARADVHKLQTMDAKAIMAACGTAAAKLRQRQTLSPVVDGRSLPRNPFTPDAPEVSRDVPVIIGTCKDESTLFLSADPNFQTMTVEQAQARFKMMAGPKADQAFAVYRAARPNDKPIHWVTSLATDSGTWANSIRLAERKAAQHAAPVYMFRLDWETPILGGMMKTPHGLEVPLVFDNVETKRVVLGSGPQPQTVANAMANAWIAFARTGNPSQPGLVWPAYDATGRKTMLFDVKSHVVADPDKPKRELWVA